MEGAGGEEPDGVGCPVSGDTCLRVSPQLSPRLRGSGSVNRQRCSLSALAWH
jgi:hypothetical protein